MSFYYAATYKTGAQVIGIRVGLSKYDKDINQVLKNLISKDKIMDVKFLGEVLERELKVSL